MFKKRIIARLDVKNEFVIKGINLEGLRKVGDPVELARKYYNEGVDEIIFMDAVASLYGRNNLLHIIEEACKEVFIPITIGGGIRTVGDIELALKSGADKIAVNTQFIKTPELIKEASRVYGSQCIVCSIEAKRKPNGWEAYIENGREATGIDVIDWATYVEDLGAGELLITSIDQEGTRKGFELELLQRISTKLSIPVIASGGAGNPHHVSTMFTKTDVSAAAIASIIHYELSSISNVKAELANENIRTRL
jgi:imidazole glycerol-phosphate synthase subunit HisF